MNVAEIIEVDLDKNEIVTAIEFGPQDGDQADVTFKYEWEWNKEENQMIVTDSWVEKIEFNENKGCGIKVSFFAHATVNDEYIQTLINK